MDEFFKNVACERNRRGKCLLTYLTPWLLEEHRASTNSRHFSLFWANWVMVFQSLPAAQSRTQISHLSASNRVRSGFEIKLLMHCPSPVLSWVPPFPFTLGILEQRWCGNDCRQNAKKERVFTTAIYGSSGDLTKCLETPEVSRQTM